MEIVQLWGLQDVYDYIYKNILDPVWEFVSSCISTGFTYLANGISIALNAVLNSLFGEIISIFLDWFYAKWFALQSAILLLLDCIEDCFNIVSGLSPVYLRAGGGTRAVTGRGVPILLAVFQQKAVQNAIIVMIIVGFWLCFAMAILATAKTILELGGEQSKPVTHVLKMTAKSLLYLVLAPFTAVALILLSQAILTTIDRGLTEGEGKTSIARIIFCISSLDAIDTSITSDGAEYNVSYADGPSKASLTDKYRAKFYYEDDHFLIPNFVNPIVARLTFTFWGFDYFISLGCGIFFTVIMCMVLAVFIGRIFDVVVLLIIEPFFVAMMPFDDGEYYKKWFELFLGKLFQGFGSVVGMRVYLMILEQLFAGNISFSNSNSVGARLQDYLIMLLFAMGGGVAVQHVGPLITGILSQGAASGEQAYAAAGGAVGKYIANKEMGFVKKAATSTAKKIGGGIGMGIMEIAKFQGRRGGAGGAGGIGGPGGIGGAAGAAGGAGGALGAALDRRLLEHGVVPLRLFGGPPGEGRGAPHPRRRARLPPSGRARRPPRAGDPRCGDLPEVPRPPRRPAAAPRGLLRLLVRPHQPRPAAGRDPLAPPGPPRRLRAVGGRGLRLSAARLLVGGDRRRPDERRVLRRPPQEQLHPRGPGRRAPDGPQPPQARNRRPAAARAHRRARARRAGGRRRRLQHRARGRAVRGGEDDPVLPRRRIPRRLRGHPRGRPPHAPRERLLSARDVRPHPRPRTPLPARPLRRRGHPHLRPPHTHPRHDALWCCTGPGLQPHCAHARI